MNNYILSLIIIGIFTVIGIGFIIVVLFYGKKQNTIFDNILANNTDYQNLKIKQNNLKDNYLKAMELRENIEKKEKELIYSPKDYVDLELQKMKIDFQKISTDYYDYIATREQAINLYCTIRDKVYYSNEKII